MLLTKHAGAVRGFSTSAGPVERLPRDETSPWWGEHRSRYRYAQQLAPDSFILDVACGTGYGTLMLSEAGARFVAGCDLSVRELDSQTDENRGDRLAFVAGHGNDLPFADGSFDLVVSFETLEHVSDGARFIHELKRVLKSGGRLLLSTPNAGITSRYARNPFHVHEYTAAELHSVLTEHFSTVEISGQVLDKRYAISPFLPGYDRADGWRDHARLILWKMIRRLPRAWGMVASRVVLRRELYPSERDYAFDGDPASAHVLLALCRRT